MAISRNNKEIKSNKLFSGLEKAGVEPVFKHGKYLQLPEGEIVYQTGDETKSIYLLLSGEVKIKYPSHHYISKKTKDDFFGEKEYFDGNRRVSSAVTNNSCLIYEIPLALFKKLLDSKGDVRKNIDNYGEVVLPEIDQTAESGISFSSSDKPISFKATNFDNENNDNQTIPEIINETITQIMTDVTNEKNEIPEIILKNNDNDIFIDGINDLSRIELDIPKTSIKNGNLEKDRTPQLRNPGNNRVDLKEIFETLLITNSAVTVFETIQSIIIAVKKLLSSEAGEIYTMNENAGELLKYSDDNGSLKTNHYKISEGLTGTCALQRKILNFDEPTKDTRFVNHIDQPGESGNRKIVYVPLISTDNQLVGVLQIARSENRYSENEIGKLELISEQIAMALEKSKRFEQVLDEEREKTNYGIYNFLEDNITIPIEIINSYAAILKDEEMDPKETDILPLFQLFSKLLRDIIKTALDFGKQDFKLDLKKSNLKKFLKDVSILFSEYCEARGVNLFVKFGPAVIMNFDAGRLFMAIFQLIKNACDASAEDSNVYMSFETDSDVAKIVVLDEGTGIEDFMQPGLFNPVFDNTKNRKNIGLELSKKIVDLHRGNIKFTTVKGKGSTFTISLPVTVKGQETSLLEHFEPAFRMDESEMDFGEYLNEDIKGDEEIMES